MKHTRTLAFLSAACLALSGTGAALAPLPACAYMAPAADTQTGVLDGMKYTIQYGYCMITGFTDALPADLTIPSEINGVKVTRIDTNAFSDCTTLRSVTMPDTLTEIGFSCFSNCTELAEIKFPKEITQFGQYAFYGTKWLKAFQEKNELAIAANVLVDGTACIGDVTVPDGITIIGLQAFEENEKLTGITLPDSLTLIDSWAFEKCIGLKTLTVPGSVKEIGRGAFRSCSGLESVTLKDGIEKMDDEAFASCDALTSITLPKTLNRLNGAFCKCGSLKEVTVPERIKLVDPDAFTECPQLESVTVLGYYTHLSDQDWNAVAISNTGHWSDKFTYTGIIRGYTGSFAQNYAEHFQLRFESLGDAPTAGKCGSDMTWTLQDSTLTVDGSGEMDNYFGLSKFNGGYDNPLCYQGVAPWFMHRDKIKEVVVGKDAAEIASGAFADMTAMESITFLNPETSIPFGKFTISTGNNEEGKRYYGGVIRGYADSTAQDYAENYDIRFEVLEDAPAVTTTAAAVTTTAKTVAATTTKTVATTTAKTAATTTEKTVAATTAKTAATTTEKTTAATTAKTTAATTAKTAATTTVKTSPGSTVKTAATTTAKTVATTTVKTAAATTAKTAATTTQTTPLTTMGMTTTALLTTVVSTSAPDDTFRGKCGESATWAFNLVLENLTIGGDGDMQDYDIEGDNETPWFDYGIESRPMVQRIRKIEIEDGITGIGNNAFACCWSVKDIAVPGSVRSIGENAFYNCGALERLVILNKDCEIADSEWTVCSGIKDNHAFFDGKIIGFPGSTAQKYAEKYGYRFEALDFDPDSIYPVEGIIGYVKLVPYLNRDGYTEAEQAAYQKHADAFVKNIAKITVTGNFLMENEEDPDLTEMLYDETITVMDDPAELAKLSAYDSEPVVFAVMPDPYDAPGQIRYDVHFLDKDGKSLLDIHGETDTFTEKQVVRSYYNKTMTVVDLSKLTAENSGMLYSAENKSLSIEYAQTDYDCKTVLGDVDGSNDISVADAQTVLKAYTEQVAGKASGLDNGQTFAADVNRDSAVSVEDAQLILKYYTEKNVAGKDIAWKDILNPEQNAAAETPRKENLSFKQIHPDNDPEQNTLQAYWLDISEKKDFVFDGDLLEIEIQVAEDAADGSYPFEIYYTDFSNYNANADEKGKLLSEVETKTGYVCVNQGAPSPSVLSDKMTLTVGSVSVKPGKTARLCVRIDNNPGFVGFIIRMRYNQDVMTVTQAAAGSDFAEAAKLTTYTLDEKA